jgi:6-phosphofructo-2-kinase
VFCQHAALLHDVTPPLRLLHPNEERNNGSTMIKCHGLDQPSLTCLAHLFHPTNFVPHSSSTQAPKFLEKIAPEAPLTFDNSLLSCMKSCLHQHGTPPFQDLVEYHLETKRTVRRTGKIDCCDFFTLVVHPGKANATKTEFHRDQAQQHDRHLEPWGHGAVGTMDRPATVASGPRILASKRQSGRAEIRKDQRSPDQPGREAMATAVRSATRDQPHKDLAMVHGHEALPALKSALAECGLADQNQPRRSFDSNPTLAVGDNDSAANIPSCRTASEPGGRSHVFSSCPAVLTGFPIDSNFAFALTETQSGSPTSPLSPNQNASSSRRQSQHSDLAKAILMTTAVHLGSSQNGILLDPSDPKQPPASSDVSTAIARNDAPPSYPSSMSLAMKNQLHVVRTGGLNGISNGTSASAGGVGNALSDTPTASSPGTPRQPLHRHNSSGGTPRMRPTTLDIPGLTRSKVSPDGKIAKRDVGSKLIIVMVGLPARGKSYITKKLARYMNWLQHDTRIFNVGERRRVVAHHPEADHRDLPELSGPQAAARALMGSADIPIPTLVLPSSVANGVTDDDDDKDDEEENMEHSAGFFDPNNKKAALIREQCAMDTLDELLNYILDGDGAIGILDATNSTINRRKKIMERIRARDTSVNVLYIESMCEDPNLLEANMRLKLSGPDYKDKDPVASLMDFKKRVAIYEKQYVPLGEHEQKKGMSYIKFIDVGKQVIHYNVKGFLSTHVGHYLLNFNLAPRQIWITRHGESLDNVSGKIGGDSSLSPNGKRYAKALTEFTMHMHKEWEVHQLTREQNVHLPPIPGDHTPPNPYINDGAERAFCVWTSMLKRSVETASSFPEDDFDVKQFRMLDEINAGIMEGMTYDEIKSKYYDEFARRQADKLSYRYPGPGGESYLDVINRLRQIIVELERMTDHCLLIAHRSVARILLAYFQNLPNREIARLECPLGMLYSLEPVSFLSLG